MPTQAQLYGTPRCGVAVSNSYDSCGTVTRANIGYATPSGLTSIFKDGSSNWRDMQSLLTTQLELKACGTRTYGLYDWLMSSAKSVGSLVNKKSIKGSPTLVEPFILANQKSVINTDYWALGGTGWKTAFSSGSFNTGTAYTAGSTGPLTSGNIAAADRVVRVITRQGLDSDAKWFAPGATIHIFSRSVGGTAERGQWKILASAAESANPPTYVDLALESQNAGSSTPFAVAPATGVVVIGVNNVNDFESWCNNRPALNPNRHVPFWVQTSRYSLCVDSFYKEWLAELMTKNELFKKFGDVPLAERNRQLGEMWQKEFLNSFFWGKPLNANQTLANWQSLPQIASYTSSTYDTGTEGKLIGYRANAVGVYEQLRGCGRVYDLQNQTLNLVEFFDLIYDIYRSRTSQGRDASEIDVYTDSRTAARFQQAWVAYINAQTGNSAQYNYTPDKGGKLATLGFIVRKYPLIFPQGVTLNIITDHFFDDFASAASTESMASTGRFMMILDLGGSIYPGIVGSNRKVHTTGDLEALSKIDSSFACVMENPTREVTLNSLTWSAIVECPSDSVILENFNDTVPTASGSVGSAFDYYG